MASDTQIQLTIPSLHKWWLFAYYAPNHYLNQSYNIVSWAIRKKRQWNLKQNTTLLSKKWGCKWRLWNGGHFGPTLKWLIKIPSPMSHRCPTKDFAHMIQNMMTSSLLAICAGNSPVTGEFPAQRPVTRSFDVFFDLRLNKRLGKQSWGW